MSAEAPHLAVSQALVIYTGVPDHCGLAWSVSNKTKYTGGDGVNQYPEGYISRPLTPHFVRSYSLPKGTYDDFRHENKKICCAVSCHKAVYDSLPLRRSNHFLTLASFPC